MSGEETLRNAFEKIKDMAYTPLPTADLTASLVAIVDETDVKLVNVDHEAAQDFLIREYMKGRAVKEAKEWFKVSREALYGAIRELDRFEEVLDSVADGAASHTLVHTIALAVNMLQQVHSQCRYDMAINAAARLALYHDDQIY